MQKVNLAETFERFQEQWSPKIIGDVNDCQVKVAKVQGEFVWHRHEEEDELFLVVKGRFTLRFRDREEG
jgi:mannose-6-phosphate isomerase-like protein (cupin superfamily)